MGIVRLVAQLSRVAQVQRVPQECGEPKAAIKKERDGKTIALFFMMLVQPSCMTDFPGAGYNQVRFI